MAELPRKDDVMRRIKSRKIKEKNLREGKKGIFKIMTSRELFPEKELMTS